MTIQQAIEITAKKNELIELRGKVCKQLESERLSFNCDCEDNRCSCYHNRMISLNDKIKGITKQIVAMPSIPLSVFKQMKGIN